MCRIHRVLCEFQCAFRGIVLEGNRVSLGGEEMSLSAAALKVSKEMDYKTPAASGSEYWMFDGELLDEMRRRLEAEQFDEQAPA